VAEELTIDKLYAFIIDEEGKGEGICTFSKPDGSLISMVGTNRDRAHLEDLKILARDIARKTGKPIKLLCFSVREEVERILPRTYEIKGKTIRCLICGRVSYHPQDIATKYCGHCRRFHED
jgi:hypothetical protein